MDGEGEEGGGDACGRRGLGGLILKAVDNVSVAPNFTLMFVPTIPMVSMPFDINLEENADGVFAVEVSDASAPNNSNLKHAPIAYKLCS